MLPRPSSQGAFTLIELLVVLAIIAILSVVVILTLNPAELLRQSRDSNRVSDMDTLTHTLGIYSSDVTSGNLGSANMIYVSIPDPTATTTAGDQCQGLGLPALPAAYTYHCAATSTNRNIDCTGWIPVNLKLISSGSPIGNLPVDPTNNSSSRLYYTYATNGTMYEVTSPMESQKYKLGGGADVISGDGGTLAATYEKGTKLGLMPVDYGDSSLVGWWPLNEGSGSSTYDYSGNGNTGAWGGSATGISGYYSPGKIGPWAGAFDGSSTIVNIPASPSLKNIGGDVTLAVWIYLTSTPQSHQFNEVTPLALSSDVVWGATLSLTSSTSVFSITLTGGAQYNAIGPALALNTWYYLVGIHSGASIAVYVNGVASISSAALGNLRSFGGVNSSQIGGLTPWSVNFPGFINDARIYNRALSAPEIQSIFNGGK